MASISSRAVQAVEKARENAHSWNRIAVFLQENQDLAARAYHSVVEPCVMISVIGEDDPVAAIVEYAGRASAAGAQIEATIRARHSGLTARFGSASVEFYARSEQVCAGPVSVSTPSLVGPLAALVAEGSAA